MSKPDKTSLERGADLIRRLAKTLPDAPGVYRMLDEKGDALYVGKAKSLKKDISFFLTLLRELQKIDAEFPLQYAVCLAEIALDEGLSLTNLSERANMPLSTVSRIVGALSRNRQKGVPYDLVRVAISAEERRKKELYLTARGRNIIQDIALLIRDADDQRLHA